jgi:hypothetical protein
MNERAASTIRSLFPHWSGAAGRLFSVSAATSSGVRPLLSQAPAELSPSCPRISPNSFSSASTTLGSLQHLSDSPRNWRVGGGLELGEVPADEGAERERPAWLQTLTLTSDSESVPSCCASASALSLSAEADTQQHYATGYGWVHRCVLAKVQVRRRAHAQHTESMVSSE